MLIAQVVLRIVLAIIKMVLTLIVTISIYDTSFHIPIKRHEHMYFYSLLSAKQLDQEGCEKCVTNLAHMLLPILGQISASGILAAESDSIHGNKTTIVVKNIRSFVFSRNDLLKEHLSRVHHNYYVKNLDAYAQWLIDNRFESYTPSHKSDTSHDVRRRNLAGNNRIKKAFDKQEGKVIPGSFCKPESDNSLIKKYSGKSGCVKNQLIYCEWENKVAFQRNQEIEKTIQWLLKPYVHTHPVPALTIVAMIGGEVEEVDDNHTPPFVQVSGQSDDDKVIMSQLPEDNTEGHDVVHSVNLGTTENEVMVSGNPEIKKVKNTGFLQDKGDNSLFSVFSRSADKAELELTVVSIETEMTHSAKEEVISKLQGSIPAFGEMKLPAAHNIICPDEHEGIPVYTIFQSLLDSGIEKGDVFSNIKVPPAVSISKSSMSSTKRELVGMAEVNAVNSLILPFIFNRSFVFLDIYRTGVKAYYHVSPVLECTVYRSLIEMQQLAGPKAGLPVFVVLSPGYIYFFYEKKTDSLFWARVSILLQDLVSAYSGELVSFKENIALPRGEGILRLVPTYQGVMFQHFQSGELLNSLSEYIGFITTVGRMIAQERMKSWASKEPDPSLPRYLTAQTPVLMGQDDSATSQRYLVDITALKEQRSDWLAISQAIMDYATNPNSNYGFLDTQGMLKKVQAEYRDETNARMRAKMFHVLSEIPFNDRLRELVKLTIKFEDCLKRLKKLHVKDYGQVETNIAETEKRLEFGINALCKLEMSYEKNLKLFELGVVQLQSKTTTSQELFKKYITEYIKELEKIIQIENDSDNVDDWEVYEAIIEKLAIQIEPLTKTLPDLPGSPEDMLPWMQQYIGFELYNEDDVMMFIHNAVPLHNILKAKGDLQAGIDRSMKGVRSGMISGLYTASAVDMWPFHVTELYQRLYPSTQLSQDAEQRFHFYLPVLKEEVLGRLWSDAHIVAKLKPALLAISSLPRAQVEDSQDSDNQLVLSTRELSHIKRELSVKVTGRGLVLKAQEKEQEVGSPLLRVATSSVKTTKKTPLKVLNDVINHSPDKFCQYWGEKLKEGIRLEQMGYWQRKDEEDNLAAVENYMKKYFPGLCKEKTQYWIQRFPKD